MVFNINIEERYKYSNSRIIFGRELTVMAAIFTVFCAIVCVFAIVYALKAYRDTQKLKMKIKEQEKSRPKPRF